MVSDVINLHPYSAASIRVGYALGSKNAAGARTAAQAAILASLGTALVISLAMVEGGAA